MSLLPDWTHAARCREIGSEPFFFDGEGQIDYEPARRICQTCPVRTLCLETAMTLEGDHTAQYRGGMWGGLTPHQRYLLHRRRTAEPDTTAA